MKRFKRFSFVLIGVLLFASLFSLIIPSHVGVTRATLINAPLQKVKEQIADLHNWKNWYPALKDSPGVNYLLRNGHQTMLVKNKDGKEMEISLVSSDSSDVKVSLN